LTWLWLSSNNIADW